MLECFWLQFFGKGPGKILRVCVCVCVGVCFKMFVYCSFAASVDVMLENAHIVFQACLPFFLLFTPWSSIGTLPLSHTESISYPSPIHLEGWFSPTQTNQSLDFATILWIINAPSAVQSGCLARQTVRCNRATHLFFTSTIR